MQILLLIKQYSKILIALLLVTGTFYSASRYYNHKIDKINADYSNYRLTMERNIEISKVNVLTQQNKLKEENLILIKKLEDLQNDSFKKYTELQATNTNLRNAVNNGTKRLYINATCPKPSINQSGETETANASSVDNGEASKAVISARDGAAIIAIVEKGDKYKAQLEALQEWVNTTVENSNN